MLALVCVCMFRTTTCTLVCFDHHCLAHSRNLCLIQVQTCGSNAAHTNTHGKGSSTKICCPGNPNVAARPWLTANATADSNRGTHRDPLTTPLRPTHVRDRTRRTPPPRLPRVCPAPATLYNSSTLCSCWPSPGRRSVERLVAPLLCHACHLTALGSSASHVHSMLHVLPTTHHRCLPWCWPWLAGGRGVEVLTPAPSPLLTRPLCCQPCLAR